MIPVDPSRDRFHVLWDSLLDFEAGSVDQALEFLLTSLSSLIGATNASWFGMVHVDVEAARDPVGGWRPRFLHLLRPAPQINEGMRVGLRRLDLGVVDPTTVKAFEEAGKTFRVFRLCDAAPATWFESEYYRRHYRDRGMHDAVFAYFPMNDSVESAFALMRDGSMPPFSSDERDQFAYALRGIKWFHQRLTLSRGLMLAVAPLTPTERTVLHALLGGDSEKIVASKLGLSHAATHQHVASIYRKFALNSRAELLALWLGKR